MTARWKYQLKWGLLWGTFMALAMSAFNAWENENWSLFFTWNFLLRLVVFVAIGVFVIGYFNWKESEKAAAKKDQ